MRDTLLPLPIARRVAGLLRQGLAPACERIEIAGSIRRGRPFCRDVELVAIPRWREEPKPECLFDQVKVNLLHRRLEELVVSGRGLRAIKPGTAEVIDWPLKPEARYWRLLLGPDEVPIDLFVTTPEQWGVIYLIRTGCAEFAKAALARWKRISGGGQTLGGRFLDARGRPLDTPEEEDVFRVLQMPYVQPGLRGSARRVPNDRGGARDEH